MVTEQNNNNKFFTDIFVGVAVISFVGYMIYISNILLGLITALILLSFYVPVRQERFEHIPPLVLGWLIAIGGYLSTDGRFELLSIILGIAVYIAWTFYRING